MRLLFCPLTPGSISSLHWQDAVQNISWDTRVQIYQTLNVQLSDGLWSSCSNTLHWFCLTLISGFAQDWTNSNSSLSTLFTFNHTLKTQSKNANDMQKIKTKWKDRDQKLEMWRMQLDAVAEKICPDNEMKRTISPLLPWSDSVRINLSHVLCAVVRALLEVKLCWHFLRIMLGFQSCGSCRIVVKSKKCFGFVLELCGSLKCRLELHGDECTLHVASPTWIRLRCRGDVYGCQAYAVRCRTVMKPMWHRKGINHSRCSRAQSRWRSGIWPCSLPHCKMQPAGVEGGRFFSETFFFGLISLSVIQERLGSQTFPWQTRNTRWFLMFARGGMPAPVYHFVFSSGIQQHDSLPEWQARAKRTETMLLPIPQHKTENEWKICVVWKDPGLVRW